MQFKKIEMNFLKILEINGERLSILVMSLKALLVDQYFQLLLIYSFLQKRNGLD